MLVYGIDQLTKFFVVENLVEREQTPLLGEFLQLQFVKNPGAAFSIGSGSTWIFAIIAAAVVVAIILFARRIGSVGWALVFGLLLGGTVGNLTDRLTREPGFGVGHVIDFIQLWVFPAIFNIADVAIVFSMVIFVILTIRGVRIDGTRIPKEPKKNDAASHIATDDVAGSSTPKDSA